MSTTQFVAGQGVNRPGTAPFLENHEKRIRRLERAPAGGGIVCGAWYYVGTPTQTAGQVDDLGNAVDTVLIPSNPTPWNVTPWIPFLNGWNNSLGDDAPMSFMTDGCFLFLRGAVGGGTVGTTIFNLPAGFRPVYQQPLVVASGSPTTAVRCLVHANGDVEYVAIIT